MMMSRPSFVRAETFGDWQASSAAADAAASSCASTWTESERMVEKFFNLSHFNSNHIKSANKY